MYATKNTSGHILLKSNPSAQNVYTSNQESSTVVKVSGNRIQTTSIKVDPDLWKEVKIEAIRRGIHVSELFEQALIKEIGYKAEPE